MRVLEVHLIPPDDRPAARLRGPKLLAYVNLVVGDDQHQFKVHDLKLVDTARGLVLSMPTKALLSPCSNCRQKCPVTAQYCGECGFRLPPPVLEMGSNGREKIRGDTFHPINRETRKLLSEAVFARWRTAA